MRIIIFLLIAVLFALQSCAPAYVPNIVNAPLLSNQGEFQGSIGTGTNGFDPQFAYAVNGHIGVMLNGSFASRHSDSLDNYHKHSFVEAGGGFYHPFADAGRIELFGGFGRGSVDSYYSNSLFTGISKGTYSRFFIQPSIGASTGVFSGGLTTRFSFVNMKMNNYDTGHSGRLDPYFEPALTARIGYKYAFWFIQIGFSIPLSTNNYDFQPFMLSTGLQMKLGRKYIEKQSQNSISPQ